jgi:hypothetical protein
VPASPQESLTPPRAGGALTRLFRRLTTANLNLGVAAGRLALAYVEEVTASLRELGDAPIRAPESAPPEPEASPPLVLEASAGKPAAGAFLLHNRLPARVEAPLVVSAFSAEGGHQASPEIRFEPAQVGLDPGQQALVRFLVKVDQLAAGVDYHGDVTLPGLPNGRVALVLRRRGRAVARAGRAPNA